MSSTTPAPFPAYTPSVIILNPASKAFVDQASVQIAPWLMGAMVDLFLQGILVAQITNYFTYNINDSAQRRFALLVVLLTALCLLKSAQNITIVWNLLITNFANPDQAMILTSVDWWDYTEGLSTAIIAALVQAFFIYRYWLLTRRWAVCALLLAGMFASILAASLLIPHLVVLNVPMVQKWAEIHFASAIVTDTLITTTTAYHLYRQKTMVYSTTATQTDTYPTSNGRATIEITTVRSTARMIDRLIRMTWQSALPPTLCVIINAVVLRARPNEMTHIAFNIFLPKIYAISLMYTLNLGNEMRTERRSDNGISLQNETRPPPKSRQSPVTARLGINPRRSFGSNERSRDIGFGNGQLARSLSSKLTERRSGEMDIRVDTVVTRSQQREGDVEMGDFHKDAIKSIDEGRDSEFERAVWEKK